MSDGPLNLTLEMGVDGQTLAERATWLMGAWPRRLPPLEGWRYTHADVDDDTPLQSGLPNAGGADLPDDAIGVIFEAGAASDRLEVYVAASSDGEVDWTIEVSVPVDELAPAVGLATLHALVALARDAVAEGGAVYGGVYRKLGGAGLPAPPVAGQAAHLLVCTREEVDDAYEDPEDFWQMWDSRADHDHVVVCTRALDAWDAVEYVAETYSRTMRAVRSKRNIKNGYPLAAEEAAAERAWLAQQPAALEEIFYDAGDQRVEYALRSGHPISSRDLSSLVRIRAHGVLADGRPARLVYVRVIDPSRLDEAVATCGELGAEIWGQDEDGAWVCLWMPA